jgi:hypothetical protein
VAGIGLSQQGLVQLVDRLLAAAGGDLHEGGGVGHGVGDAYAAEASPGQGIGHLRAQCLEAEPITKAQEHQAQVRLHGDRGPADHGMEEGDERFEEHRVVEQAVHLLQPWWKAQNLRRQDCLPQRLLGLYFGAQQRWLQSLRKGAGAIVASFGPEREHPPNTNALVTGDFHIDFFRSK